MYWALDEEHPFKVAIRRSLTLNKSYSASEIQEILAPIVQYHLHKVLKPRKYVVLLKSMYATDRTLGINTPSEERILEDLKNILAG